MINVENSNTLNNTSSTNIHNIIYNEMKMCLKHISFKEFPIEWEINILDLLPKKYRKKYSILIQSILQEAKDIYIENMQNFVMKVVLSLPPKNGDSFSAINCTNYKLLEEKQIFNYSKYFKHRKLLKKKYFLSLEPIKIIINMAQLKLPTVICDFTRYYHSGIMSLNDFQDMINSDIKKGSSIIENQFYIEISKVISESKVLRNTNLQKLPIIMKCTTNVFVQQILNVLINSVNHMLNIMGNGFYCPQIKFQFILQDSQLLISPSIEEVYSVYHNVIDNIGSIVQDLIPLEEWLNMKTNLKYIKVKLPDWYLEETHKKLQIILYNLFEPLKKHVMKISEEFHPIYALNMKKRILSLSSGNVNFNLYFKQVQKYNVYFAKATEMLENSYYAVGMLEQHEAKESLKKEACNVVNRFLSKLIKYHQEFNFCICSEFEDLQEKALNIPRDAKPLIELTEYISYASNELIEELECKIQESIRMLSILLEITVLTEEHIKLNERTINWLHEIEPVFKQNHTLCEAMKNEVEDNMQKRIIDLNSEVDKIVPQLSVLDNMDDIDRIEEYFEYYRSLLKQINVMTLEMQRINEEETLFKFPETEFPKVIELHEIVIPFHDLIHVIYQWKKDNAVWLDGPFEWLSAVVIENKTLSYFERITEMSKTFKTKIKMDLTANRCFKFSGIADDPDAMQQPAPLKLCWQALNNINNFKKYLPLVMCMCNPALQKRHWTEMSGICNFNLTPNAGTSLRKIIAFDLMNDIEKYEAISISANRELQLQQKISEILEEWNKISFKIRFDTKSGMNVFSNLSVIEVLLEEHFIIIEEMRTSSFVKPITSTVTEFFTSLVRIQEIINQWDYNQLLIFSLDSIFCYPNVETYLPKESILYKEVGKVLLDIQNTLSETPTFLEIDNSEILTSLCDAAEKLEKINQEVQNYIESKKLCFPRFFFLSDKEIQKILFESNNLENLQIPLNKCFDGIKKVKLNKRKFICSVIGDHGEELHLEKFIPEQVYSNHEGKWLMDLETEMSNMIKKNIFQCFYIFNQTFTFNSIENFSSMAIICTYQLHWTSEVHNSFTPFNLEALKSLYLKYIDHLSHLINEMRKYSLRRYRDTLMSLITVVTNQRDIIKLLLDKNITSSTDFVWIAQLKYYLEDNDVKVSMFDATIRYGYEYSYYKQYIVNTNLTNRCFHTLMQAYKYNLYGAIIGLSATGKTETVKSLAKAIAVQFRIFNCTDTLSYSLLCQIFKGLISSKVWLCFEDFDKLNIELLSMITQNLTCISQAISATMKVITFEGSSLNLNPNGYICIVRNLGSFKHFDLPDNLKVLFRTVSMKSPDIKRIVEVEFYAGGLSDSKLLTSKLIALYQILSQQLWCKTCNINNVSYAKTIVKSVIILKKSFPDENETELLLRSLVDINLPRLCNTDALIFKNAIHNVFPDTVLLSPNYTMFLKTLESTCKFRSLHIHDVFKLKIIQAFELMYVYQALIFIGDPFVGKTEILHVLIDILLTLDKQSNKFGVNVMLENIVPAAANINQLFGYFDKKSKIWKDGVCSKIFRSFSENDTFNRKWIVFDGPLNDTWIENLYSVLDINRALYLTSGEKINLTDSVSVIFETMNMVGASPAILSRCGIIYIDSHSSDWRSHIKTHISKHDIYNEHEDVLLSLCNWVIDPCLQFIQEHCSSTSVVGQLHYIMSMLNLLEMYLRDAQEENTEENGKMNHFIIWMQAALILSIVWGLGGNLNMDSHIKFNSFCVSLWSGSNEEYPKPEIIKNFDITLPHEGLIQDNFYIFKSVGSWKYWGDLLKTEKILEVPDYNEIFVPTVNTMKHNHILSKHVKYKKPILVCGDMSIGKTSSIQNFLKNKLPEEKYFLNLFSFTSLDTVNRTQHLLLSKLNKIRKTLYGTPKNQFCINFIDDLNVERNPHISEVNGILELLRQYHSYSYFYDINEPEKIFVRDVMFLLAIIGNIGIKICPRFLRHFNIYTMYTPTTDSIFRIFSSVLFVNLKRNSFAADVLSSVTNITNATIDIYSSLLKTMHPVPNKFQYEFSLRDISRVINGCSLLQKESVETKVIFIRLWAHEIWRVFGDRMLDSNDKEWLYLQTRETVKRHFKDSFETAFDYLPKFEGNQITKDSFNDLMFSNFMDIEKDRNKKYEEINSIEKLKSKISIYLNEYNNNLKKRIDIVLSQYVLECLIKTSRILAIPRNNLLMISSIGSGRKSLTSLAAYMQQQELYEPSVYSYCDFNLWRKDLKILLQKCGGSRKYLTFFIKDKQIKDEFLRDISSLLATGEIPDLFSVQERRDIIEMVRLNAQGGNRNTEISIRSIMNYFLEQCKNKLHIVICLNPMNKEIRSHLQKHPELIKYCTINWYETWPRNALMQIGSKYIQDINVEENIKTNIIKACITFYEHVQETSSEYLKETGRIIHITLSAFLHMLKLYIQLMSKKQKSILVSRNRYLTGLEKLELAAQQVEKMKATLTMLKPQLELSAQQTIITMKEVENENLIVERATAVVQQEEEIANKKAEIAGRLKMECEADLAIAIPILEDAIAALNTLKPTDITLVKAMKNPPDTVKLVMAAICVMFDIPSDKSIDPVTGKKYTDYWSPSKRILGDMNFLQNLKDYDKDNIPHHVMQVIKKTYMTDNNFKPHIVVKASSAAEGLCKWVRAMVSYDEVTKAVAPKKEKLSAAQKECNEAEAFLNEKRRTLSALHAKLAALNNSLQETIQRKVELEKEVENCTNKLNKAESLIASLGGEKNRWMQCAGNLKQNYDNLIGDIIISCGIISYMASFSIAFRDKILRHWKQYIKDLKIPFTADYNLVYVLGEENEINHWYSCGLPKNRFSVENAVIMTNSAMWCLFIDSQNQANRWIKTIEKKNDLKVIKLTDPDYVSVIQYNVQSGNPVLIENVGEEIEILLDPFLLKRIYMDEDVTYLDTGCDVMKYSPNFRFYVTTRLFNPLYSDEVFSKLTVIDFSIPNEALQDRLLDLVISKEKPELQEKFEILLMEDANNKKILKQQEDNILSTLSSTTTNILEDESAIRILDASKNLLSNVIKKQEVAKVMSLEIRKYREAYIQFVKFCTDLFNTLNALSYLNHMYQFSFSWFMQLYVRSIETSNRSTILEKRLGYLKSSFIQNLHRSTCRSLLEKHRILYSFLLCSKILLDVQQTTEKEIQYFMSSNLNQLNIISNCTLDWLPSDVWIKVYDLSKTLTVFHDLLDDLCQNDEAWKQYYNSEALQNHLLPKPWVNKLSSFQTLILMKILRPDKIIIRIMKMIEDILGNTQNYSPQLKISQSYVESTCLTPLLFILPTCSSPLSFISAYASTKGYSSKFVSLSMNKGQEKRAQFLIEKAQREGGWVFLQNCHLVTDWMIQLEKICENCNVSSVSLDFRLWLSSYSTKEFPISILQNSIKITHDYPLNIKETLLSIYQSEPIVNKDFFEGCPGKDKVFSKLLFGLCLFHIVIKEKINFGIQSWNIPYEFDYADLQLSMIQLQNLINCTDDVPFNTIAYFIGECNYGGKVIDDLDERCLKHLLHDYCNSNIIKDHQFMYSCDIAKLIPQRCEYVHVLKYIEQMPLGLSSQVFGFNKNGIIMRDTMVATEFFTSIACMNPVASLLSKESSEDQVLLLIDDITNKLCDLTVVNEFKNKHTLLLEDPLENVLLHEIKLLKDILKVITETLNDLKLALDGYLPFTDSLKKITEDMCKNKVPRVWRNVQTHVVIENLACYIDSLLKHADFIKEWMNDGCPKVILFDALFSHKMFLSAISLTLSKKYDVRVEEVAFDFEVVTSEEKVDAEDDTYFIHGLNLAGARWDSEKNKLSENFTNVFWQKLPPIRLKYSQNKRETDRTYECPVYVATLQQANKDIESASKNYIISIPFETDKHPSYWIKRDTALFCHIP